MYTEIESIGDPGWIFILQVFLVVEFIAKIWPESVPRNMTLLVSICYSVYYYKGIENPVILFFNLLFISPTLRTLILYSNASKKDYFFTSIFDYFLFNPLSDFLLLLIFLDYLLKLPLNPTSSPKQMTLPKPK